MYKLNKNQKQTLIRITISVVLLVVALLVQKEAVKTILFIVAYLVIGYKVLLRSAKNIAKGQIFDENFLMSIATIGAFFIKQYPEAVAVMLFYETGEFFQNYAVEKSRKSISDLMDIKPDHANIEVDGDIVQVTPESVNPNDIIIVKPGERIPLDGTVIEGSSALDMSSLTGESLPNDVNPNDSVLGGSINTYGLLKVRVEKPYKESTVSKILELIENSSSKKAKTERLITRFSIYYTPVVVGAAVVIATLPPLLFSLPWNDWIYRALVFLVVSCPCALVLSVPLSFFCALGAASKNGMLVKGGGYLEALAKVDTVVFDKTGTLTKGIFKITAIHPETMSASMLLETAAIAESYSDHPISKSLKEEYVEEVDISRISDIEEIAGHGIRAIIDGKQVSVGNEKLMDMDSIKWHVCNLTGTIVHVAVEKEYMGHIVISDEIKKDASLAVEELRALGIENIVMLTGDNKAAASHMAKQAGITEYAYSLLPHEKAEYIQKRLEKMKKNHKLVFVGDGINDAPVLAQSDIGVSMGLIGSQAAIEASDVVIMDDLPSKIPKLIRLSRKTMSIAKQNMVFAIGIKLLVLSAGLFGAVSLWVAVFADVGVSIIAVLNSIRLLNKKI